MRKLHAIAFAAATTFAIAAQAAPAAETSIQVTGKVPHYTLDSEGFNDYKGSYLLSNGKTLSMVNRSGRFYAHVDGERPVELVAAGFNVFVGRDADMMLMFDGVYKGQRKDVVIKPRGAALT